MIESKSRWYRCILAAVLPLGLHGHAVAAWEPVPPPSAPESSLLAQMQERGRFGSPPPAAPEFPPEGYLQEYEDAPRALPLQDSFVAPGGSRSVGRVPEGPQYAPEGYGSRFAPGGRPQEAVEPRPATGPRPTWADPPFAPPTGRPDPAPVQDTRGVWPDPSPAPATGSEFDRSGFPVAVPDPRRQWGEAPPDGPRRPVPPAAPAGGFEHPWPSAPGTGSGYQTYPEYAPESWDRMRGTARDRVPSYPDYPRGGFDRPR